MRLPGAREARVEHIIDRALVAFDSDRKDDDTAGLAELDAAVCWRQRGSSLFSEPSSCR